MVRRVSLIFGRCVQFRVWTDHGVASKYYQKHCWIYLKIFWNDSPSSEWFYQLLVTKYNLIFFPIYEDRRCINGDYIFMYRCVFQIMCFLGTMKLESSKIYHITPGVQWKYIHMSLCDSRMTWFPDKYPYVCFLLKTLFNTKNCQNNLVLTCRLWGIYI